ncbi:hypothetical protein P170DRAFT_155163 [Aspergillus steynii IBT 23096]|uniref:Uncharacterized protein n=1 Tax=Aspergillus steynii IBT 23096 TaxID=1392250 RepID=A0A2I2GD67_9EURO|nr:uncharacterized protein P170DRAFT_155163 [Aspergillus steynii IBT 23096]PLB50844.1 hypothetical protein P170DRAFT_155163 [Aspergillus steynii IBT 23096]
MNGSILESNVSSFDRSNAPQSSFSRPTHHLPSNQTRVSNSLPSQQTDSVTAELLPPEARTRNSVHNTLKKTSEHLPPTSSNKSAEPTNRILMTSESGSNQMIPSSTKSSNVQFTSNSLGPIPTNHNGTQDNGTQEPAPGSVRPTSIPDTQSSLTSIGSSNQTHPTSLSAPNVTSPILSPIQTSKSNLPSPITSSQSNFTTDLSTPITIFPISK